MGEASRAIRPAQGRATEPRRRSQRDGEAPSSVAVPHGAEAEGGSPRACSDEELEAFLDDRCCWTIFEDIDDELRFFRRRGDVLARALRVARREIDALQEAGVLLQDAYDALQQELREAVGDAAYWKTLADSWSPELSPRSPSGVGVRAVGPLCVGRPESEAAETPSGSVAICPPPAECVNLASFSAPSPAVSKSPTSPHARDGLPSSPRARDESGSEERMAASSGDEEPPGDPREALRRAALEARAAGAGGQVAGRQRHSAECAGDGGRVSPQVATMPGLALDRGLSSGQASPGFASPSSESCSRAWLLSGASPARSAGGSSVGDAPPRSSTARRDLFPSPSSASGSSAAGYPARAKPGVALGAPTRRRVPRPTAGGADGLQRRTADLVSLWERGAPVEAKVRPLVRPPRPDAASGPSPFATPPRPPRSCVLSVASPARSTVAGRSSPATPQEKDRVLAMILEPSPRKGVRS
mmetsp:Transcript_4995/g.14660  ORF Transcript_4995/g.14660 Transcript_4995/m.14660 type:complete len:473 (-) Transcript_4995:175-1593(-)